MPRFNKKEIKCATRIAALLATLLFAFISCTSPNSPNNKTTDVTVANLCGTVVDIFMDGNLQFSLENDHYATISNVSRGSHLFEAKKKGTQILVSSATIAIDLNQTYEYDIESPCAINVTNEYGETLKISADGTYQFDLDNKSSNAITKIPFGVHSLSAAKKSDSAVVATTSIDVEEVKEYKWIIKK